MGKLLEALGTIATQFQIGIGGSGARSVCFKNAFTSLLQWQPTANRTLTLPDASGTLALVQAASSVTVYNSATQSIASGGNPAVLVFNTSVEDTDGYANLVGAPGRLTLPFNGQFIAVATVCWDVNNAGSQRYAAIRHHNVSGNVLKSEFDRIPPTFGVTNKVFFPFSGTATDYIQLTAYQDSASSRLVQGGAENCSLWLYCLSRG